MRQFVLLKYILSCLFLLGFVAGLAQGSELPKQDDEFGIFLLAIGSIFICAMIGAAIIGAMAASLFVFLLFGLAALGVLSASIAVALYKRSISAGFKTLLIIIFSFTGSILGIAGSFVISRLVDITASANVLVPTAGAGGAIGGVLMALAASKIIQAMLNSLVKRFRTA